jgi:glutathione S-transferase
VLTLYYKTTCPYSLRARLVLAEKHVPFSRRVIDPDDLPEELLEVSEGTVPVLVDGSLAITDSTVIAEYLEDAFSKPALRPFDARGRAVVRTAMRRIDQELMDPIERSKDAKASGRRDDPKEGVLDGLSFPEQKLSDKGLLLGTEFSLADVWLVAALEKAATLGLEIPARFPKIRLWQARVSERASVRAERLRAESPPSHT